ncbi:hypothetical protein GCM10028807_26090 [Spirosoma daeguense]
MAFAQRLTGYQLSNYAGTNSVYLNPSSIADSPWKMYANVVTASFQAMAQPRLPLATVPFVKATPRLGGESLAFKQADIHGPAFLLQLRNKHTFAVTTRYRSDLNMTGDYDLVRWFQGDKTPLPNMTRSLRVSADAFGEIALSYAVPVVNRSGHFLKVGGSFKYIRGLQTASLSAEGDFVAMSDQMNYTVRQMEVSYSDLVSLSRLSFGDALLGEIPGVGTGVDLGFTYEFRPQRNVVKDNVGVRNPKNKYRFRIGVSLLDMGSITYKESSVLRVMPTASSLLQANIQPPKTPTQMRDAVARTLGVLPEGEVGDLEKKLPQTLSVQLDANIGEGWFLGGTWWKPAEPIAEAQHKSGLITIGPRYESAKLEYSAMINYWQQPGKLSIGGHIRYGFLTIGSDNLLGFFSYNGLAAHIFAGVAAPLGEKKSKKNTDSDNDGIPDRDDLCPDVAGSKLFQGCPDSDRDGVQDIDDYCSTEAGLKELGGCPLQNITSTDTTGLSTADVSLLSQLRTGWLHGLKHNVSLLPTLQTYLTANPKRVVTLEFSGADQAQLDRLVSLFKEELGANVAKADRFRFTTNVVANQRAGLKLGLITTP